MAKQTRSKKLSHTQRRPPRPRVVAAPPVKAEGLALAPADDARRQQRIAEELGTSKRRLPHSGYVAAVPRTSRSGGPLHGVVVHPDDLPVLRKYAHVQELLASAGDGSGESSTPNLGPERGITGLDARGGVVYQEYNARLVNLQNRMTAYEEMRRSDCAFATIEALLTMPLLQADFHIRAGEDKAFSDFVQWNLFGGGLTHSFNRTIRSAILGVLYGFSWHYKMFERKQWQGKEWIGWRKFGERERATVHKWEFQDDGGLAGLTQWGHNPRTGSYEKVDYTIDEIMVWTWRPEAGNPEGLGAFRQAHKHWYMKQVFEEFAAIRIERQAMGVPIAIGPPEGYSETEQNLVLAQLQNIRTAHNAGMVIPDGWEVKMLELGNADVPFESHIERQHMSILETCLVQFVGFGHSGEAGSFGMSRDSSNLFLMSLEAIADWLCENVNQYMIPQLARYNGVKGELPKLAHGKVGVRDLDKFARAVTMLFKTSAGVVLPPEVEAYVREVIGLPPADPNSAPDDDKAMTETELFGDRGAEDLTAPAAAS